MFYSRQIKPNLLQMMDNPTRQLLVIGSSGQVAQALSRLNGSHGFNISSIGRPTCDITDPASLKRAIARINPDLVVNASAYTNVDLAEDEKEEAMKINMLGAENAGRITEQWEIPIIHFSTDYIYGEASNRPHSEDSIPDPLSVYAHSKLAGEQAIACNPRSVILRTAWIFSAHSPNFVKTMLRLARNSSTLKIVNDQHGNPTAASDLAEAVLTVAQRVLEVDDDDLKSFGIFNYAGQGSITKFDFAHYIFQLSSEMDGPQCCVEPISTTQFGAVAQRPLNSSLNMDKFEKIFGPIPSWKPALKNVVQILIKTEN